MSKVTIKVNYQGVGELLKSQDMADALRNVVEGAATSCGDGYSFDVKTMGTRVIASVFAEDDSAVNDNLENNTILRNLK